MPTYEYECDKCKHRFEAFQTMSAKLLKKCPKCGGKVTRLLGTGSGVIFKGSGFYQNDYKNPPKSDVKPCDPSARSACSGSSRAKPMDDKPKADGCKGCSHNHGK
jgi:putative FmdB family regulatory protein